MGILLTLSTFVILYKSYQARGYLEFLGARAKQGTLLEKDLPLFGWPGRRIKGWRRNLWLCPWLRQAGDLLEPYMFLPSLLILAWLFVLMEHRLSLGNGTILVLAIVSEALILSVLCILWVFFEGRNEREPKLQAEERPAI